MNKMGFSAFEESVELCLRYICDVGNIREVMSANRSFIEKAFRINADSDRIAKQIAFDQHGTRRHGVLSSRECEQRQREERSAARTSKVVKEVIRRWERDQNKRHAKAVLGR